MNVRQRNPPRHVRSYYIFRIYARSQWHKRYKNDRHIISEIYINHLDVQHASLIMAFPCGTCILKLKIETNPLDSYSGVILIIQYYNIEKC